MASSGGELQRRVATGLVLGLLTWAILLPPVWLLVHDKPEAKPLEATQGVVRFEDVSFEYGSVEALTHVNFEARPDHTVIRPSWVYGPEDASLNVFARLVRWVSGAFPQLGDGRQRINPVFVQDVARSVVLSIESDEARGATFEIGGPVTYTMDGVVRTVMDVLGRRKRIVHVPMGLARVGAALAEALPGRPMSRQALEFATQEAVADLGALRELFPTLELTPLPEALESYLAG